MHVCQALEQQWKRTRRMLSQLPAMQNRRSLKNGDASHSGTLFNTHPTDMWDDEKRPAVSLYLDKLLIQKCKFGSRFNVSDLYLERYSPKGSCHLDESSMNHTLAQKHLIELLMWNASCVQKHFIYTWQEPLDDQEWETVRRKSFNVLARRLKLFWCSAFILYWHWKFRLRKPCKTRKLKTGCLETAWWFLG